MNAQISSPQSHEKTRIRVEIDTHIQEFLKKGGKIDVLAEKSPLRDIRSGSSWSVLDDDLGL